MDARAAVPPDLTPQTIDPQTLRVLLDQLPAIVWTTDAELRVTATLGSFASMGSLTPVGTTLREQWGPHDPIGAVAAHERALGGESAEHEAALGGRIFMSHLEPLRAADGSVAGVIGVGVDLTEQRQMEQELRAVERSYRTLVDQLQVVTYIGELGQWGDLRFVSPAVEGLLGYAPDELIGRPDLFERIHHPDDLGRAKEFGRHLRENGRATADEYRLIARDGRVVNVMNEAMIVHDEDTGAPLFLQGVLIDVTARRELEDQLRQSQKMEAIGRLAGGIAHDFNNLLTAIKGYGEFLLADLPADGSSHRDAHEIVAAADRAAALTRQLLAFSRRQTLAPQPLDLNEVVADLEGLLGRLLGEPIELVLELATEVPPVRADRGQLEQVVMNLVVNASDAMPDGGRLTIATAATGRSVELTVADSGIGMEPEVRSHLFEPFFTTKAPGEGTGLGLATVYGIVEQSGGTIDVETAPGKGSTFTVRLPVAAEQLRPEEPAPSAPSGGDGRIMLVEDEELVRSLLQEVLERAGYDVLAAADADEATALARSAGEIDLLVTDLGLPGTGGSVLAERLARERPGLLVLYTSGYVDAEQREAADVLEKPFTPDDLLRRVGTLLRR
jgi:PAS domain S-box-containing protein